MMGHLSLYTINGIDPYNCLETNFSLQNQCEVNGNYIVNKRFGLGEIYVTNISSASLLSSNQGYLLPIERCNESSMWTHSLSGFKKYLFLSELLDSIYHTGIRLWISKISILIRYKSPTRNNEMDFSVILVRVSYAVIK